MGLNGGAWTETSTNFGTPLCDATCQPATPVGSGAHGGTFWAWFGGANAAEDATTSQTVNIPVLGSATLSFYLEVPSACANATDFLEVTIDGVQKFKIDGSSPSCGVVGYVLKTINMNAYTDGLDHTIEFHAVTSPDPAMMNVTNFFVDDVKLAVTCP